MRCFNGCRKERSHDFSHLTSAYVFLALCQTHQSSTCTFLAFYCAVPSPEAVELLTSAGWRPREVWNSLELVGNRESPGTAVQVEYAEAVSTLYTSKEGRFSDVLLGADDKVEPCWNFSPFIFLTLLNFSDLLSLMQLLMPFQPREKLHLGRSTLGVLPPVLNDGSS